MSSVRAVRDASTATVGWLGRWWPVPAVLAAGVLAVAVSAHPGPLPGEVGVVRWLQRAGEPVPTVADGIWTVTGTEAALVVTTVAAVWVSWRRRWRGVLAVAIALVTMLVVQPVAKDVVDRPRPPPAQVEVRAAHDSPSFPSGHAMSTATVWGAAAGTAWAIGRRGIALLTATPIALAAVSSAVSGVHWPSDAIAGTLLGGVAAWLVVRVLAEGPSA